MNISCHNELYRLFWYTLLTFLHCLQQFPLLGDKIATPINNSLDYDTARKTVPAHCRWPVLNMTNSVYIYQLFQLPLASKQLDAPPGPNSYLPKQTQKLQKFAYTCFDKKKLPCRHNALQMEARQNGSNRCLLSFRELLIFMKPLT